VIRALGSGRFLEVLAIVLVLAKATQKIKGL